MNLTITHADRHRNGVGGQGFYAILFRDNDEKKDMVASLFDCRGYCAVYSIEELSNCNIAFAKGNSWRGDQYEEVLRPLLAAFIAKEEEKHHETNIPNN